MADNELTGTLKMAGCLLAIGCIAGLVVRGCEPKAPDYGCVEEVTPFGVQCAP